MKISQIIIFFKPFIKSTYLEGIGFGEPHASTATNWNPDVGHLGGDVTERKITNTRFLIGRIDVDERAELLDHTFCGHKDLLSKRERLFVKKSNNTTVISGIKVI